MSPEELLRDYFHAKDENRPQLLDEVFAADARLEVRSRSDLITFPAVTVGKEAIADVLVRKFNQSFEDIRSFYLDRPNADDRSFACDWVVFMGEKASRSVRVGCGRYDWTFQGESSVRVGQLVITIEVMLVLAPGARETVRHWVAGLDYPWTSAAAVTRALPLPELAPIGEYLLRRGRIDDRAADDGYRQAPHT